MSKTVFLPSLFSIFLFLACTDQKPIVTKKPNVVFILVDDLGLHDLGITGSDFYETPHIDRLAKQGMIFTQGYAASRVCSPSRASIMTGKFTARHGITDWIGAKSGEAWRALNRHDKLLPAEYVHQLPVSDISLAEAMKAGGYTTFFSGKWHLGNKGSYPEDHGFDFNVGGWEKGSPIGGYFSPWKNPKLENKMNGENLSMRLAQETAAFIKRNTKTPFFAFLSFYAVHGPIQTTKDKWQKYRDKATESDIAANGYQMERVLPIRVVQDNPIYAGLVESMDEAVGVVLNALVESGIEENTIVIFTSDNGGVASGDAFSTSNLPLRGGKGYQWEGGIREPYFIKVPWLKSQGATNNYPVTGADFYPTILDLVGLEARPEQHVDGMSLKPLLEGKQTLAERALYWHYPHYGNQGGEPSSIIQEAGWKLIHYWEDGHDELYRLTTDSGEQNDLAAEYPTVRATMSEKLMTWLVGVNANLPEQDPQYDSVSAAQRAKTILEKQWPSLEQQRIEFLSRGFEPNADWWGSHTTKD